MMPSIKRVAVFARSLVLFVSLPSLALTSVTAQNARAQDKDKTLIQLPEPEAEPAPKVSARKKLKEVYQDKSVRAEREIVRMSDDTMINDGSYIEYYRNGKKFSEGTYVMGVPDGQWQYWHSNGQLCKTVTFRRGRPEGQWQVFREDGTLAAEKGYKNGLRDGRWVFYYEDGKQIKIESQYAEGRITGERKAYHPNGKVWQISHFKDGLRHGKWTEWNKSGNKLAEATHVEGKLDGKVTRFEVASDEEPDKTDQPEKDELKSLRPIDAPPAEEAE